MTRIICPNCRKVYVVAPHTNDFICDCGDMREPSAFTREDIFQLGEWEDYTGSGGNVTNLWRGIANNLQGTKAEIEGGDTWDVTPRGNRKDIHRTRKKLTYIDLSEG